MRAKSAHLIRSNLAKFVEEQHCPGKFIFPLHKTPLAAIRMPPKKSDKTNSFKLAGINYDKYSYHKSCYTYARYGAECIDSTPS